MKTPRTLILVAALMLVPITLAFAQDQKTDKAGPLPTTFFKNLNAGKQQTVVVYGTSLSVSGAWVTELEKYFKKTYRGKVTFVRAALSGRTSRWGLANLEKRVLSKNPDLVFIEFSANDSATKHKISIKKSEQNLDAMVRALREQNPQVDIVLQTMNPAWDSDAPKAGGKSYGSDRPQMEKYYAVYRDYAARNNLPLVDNFPVWREIMTKDMKRYKKMVSDGIHPDPDASREITWPAVKALLERARTAQ
ncbi:SGNH/GDSL hydrolase family protein [Ereboglobus luteus]|nr:GDSL-type esterase/lipase family protein [Ereboglobus luteus]